jgi:hypothetical protein
MGYQKRIVLQPRDIVLFQRLSDFGFLSTNQIVDWVYKIRRNTAKVRIWKLRSAGFLEAIPRKSADGQNLCRLNLNFARAHLDPEFVERARKSNAASVWRRSHFKHEEAVREIALRILSLCPEVSIDLDHHIFQGDWIGDYDNKSGSNKVPDFILNHNKLAAGIFEIELTAKAKNRYFVIFNRLMRNAKCPIIYICANSKISKMVREEFEGVARFLRVRGLPNTPKLIVKTFEQLTRDEDLRLLIEEVLGRKTNDGGKRIQ